MLYFLSSELNANASSVWALIIRQKRAWWPSAEMSHTLSMVNCRNYFTIVVRWLPLARFIWTWTTRCDVVFNATHSPSLSERSLGIDFLLISPVVDGRTPTEPPVFLNKTQSNAGFEGFICIWTTLRGHSKPMTVYGSCFVFGIISYTLVINASNKSCRVFTVFQLWNIHNLELFKQVSRYPVGISK